MQTASFSEHEFIPIKVLSPLTEISMQLTLLEKGSCAKNNDPIKSEGAEIMRIFVPSCPGLEHHQHVKQWSMLCGNEE